MRRSGMPLAGSSNFGVGVATGSFVRGTLSDQLLVDLAGAASRTTFTEELPVGALWSVGVLVAAGTLGVEVCEGLMLGALVMLGAEGGGEECTAGAGLGAGGGGGVALELLPDER